VGVAGDGGVGGGCCRCGGLIRGEVGRGAAFASAGAGGAVLTSGSVSAALDAVVGGAALASGSVVE
jgi:hypothetical protein